MERKLLLHFHMFTWNFLSGRAPERQPAGLFFFLLDGLKIFWTVITVDRRGVEIPCRAGEVRPPYLYHSSLSLSMTNDRVRQSLNKKDKRHAKRPFFFCLSFLNFFIPFTLHTLFCILYTPFFFECSYYFNQTYWIPRLDQLFTHSYENKTNQTYDQHSFFLHCVTHSSDNKDNNQPTRKKQPQNGHLRTTDTPRRAPVTNRSSSGLDCSLGHVIRRVLLPVHHPLPLALHYYLSPLDPHGRPGSRAWRQTVASVEELDWMDIFRSLLPNDAY